MWSCSEEMVGPSIDGISIDTFNIVPTGTSKTIDADFAQGDSIHFMGSWEFETKWIITVKGQQSGATKTLKGNGKSVDETVAWDGSSDLIFFRDGETCEATLSFEYYNGSLVAENFVNVVSTKPIEGIVLGDYDEIDAEGWAARRVWWKTVWNCLRRKNAHSPTRAFLFRKVITICKSAVTKMVENIICQEIS